MQTKRQPAWRKGLWFLATIVVMRAVSSGNLQAQTNEWIYPSGGYWDDLRNWSLGVRPASSHDVLITNAATKLFAINSNTQGAYRGGKTTTRLTVSADVSVTPSVTNVCTTVPGTATGTSFYRVAAGQTYNYDASGCITFSEGAGAPSSDPDGNRYLNTCMTFTDGPMTADSSFVCPGLISYSLVGKVGGTCVQLGTSGSFIAATSGKLVLYYNDQLATFGDNGGFWNFCLTSPPAEPPVAPSNLIATAMSSNEIDLNWQDNSSDEDGFQLERTTNSDFSTFITITLGTGVQQYSDTGLDPLLTYLYRIRACNSVGCSEYSNIATATTLDVANSWIYPSGGYWDDFRNWSFGVRPASSQFVVITNASTKLVSVDSYTSGVYPESMTVTSLTISGNSTTTNTLLLSNAGTTTPLCVQDALTILSGGELAMTNSALQVGGPAGGGVVLEGTASISGTNLFSGDLCVGLSSNSAGGFFATDGLTIFTNGYSVIGFDGAGQAVLSKGTLQAGDDGSLPNGVFVGLNSGSQGTLRIAGGNYLTPGHLCLGQEAGSTSFVWITDGELTTTNNYLTTIGGDGVGRLIIENGRLAASSMVVGTGPGSFGALFLATGSCALSGGLVVGDGLNATGIVSVIGGQLAVTNQNTVVGSYGVGQITVSSGTLLAQAINVGNSTGSVGLLTISGGTTTVPSNIVAGVYSNAVGVIQVSGGNLLILV
jgi:hypothetical protein